MSHVLKHARILLAGIETRHMSPADRERLRKIDICLIGAGAEATDYEKPMPDPSDAILVALRAVISYLPPPTTPSWTWTALCAAINEDGAPVEALKEIAADIDSLIDWALTLRERVND